MCLFAFAFCLLALPEIFIPYSLQAAAEESTPEQIYFKKKYIFLAVPPWNLFRLLYMRVVILWLSVMKNGMHICFLSHEGLMLTRSYYDNGGAIKVGTQSSSDQRWSRLHVIIPQ